LLKRTEGVWEIVYKKRVEVSWLIIVWQN
jgi:hypothetical protein